VFNFRNTSIKNKLKIVIVSTSSIVLLLASFAFISNDLISFRRNMTTELLSLADLISLNTLQLVAFDRSNETKEFLSTLKINPNIVAAHVLIAKEQNKLPPKQTIFASYARGQTLPEDIASMKIEESEEPIFCDYYMENFPKHDYVSLNKEVETGVFISQNYIEVFRNIINDDYVIGTMYLCSTLDSFYARLVWAMGIFVVIFIFSFLIALLLASKLQNLITSPIYNLLDIMRAVSSQQNYSVRAEQNNDDELGHLIDGFNHMLVQIENRDKELGEANKNLSETMKELQNSVEAAEFANFIIEQQNAELTENYVKLSQTLENLKTAQQELIQSEKMAALGQLIAGVAHEINTPLGAIRSSVENISHFLNDILDKLPEFFKSLSPERQHDFFQILHKTRESQEIVLTSKEKRKRKRALTRQLESYDIDNAASVADTLIDIGIYEEVKDFLDLLKDAESGVILHKAYQLASLQKSTQTITTASNRAAKVIFALKSFARFDHSGEKVYANVIDGIETVLTLYYNQLKHGVEVVKNYDSNLKPIYCYSDELNQIWTNLIHNALQAMDYNGTLKIDVFMEDEQMIIGITDSGSGIPENIRDKIFDPFFTTKPPGEGSGLGLDIVKRIVERHDGKVEVESESARGTTFLIVLPIS